MANLSVNLCGVTLKNPVIAASGTFGFGREFDELYDIGRLGGVSTKGLTMEPRLGNPVPRIAESRGSHFERRGVAESGSRTFYKIRFRLAESQRDGPSSPMSREKPWRTTRQSAPVWTGWRIS